MLFSSISPSAINAFPKLNEEVEFFALRTSMHFAMKKPKTSTFGSFE
jgi:hypothetical protein